MVNPGKFVKSQNSTHCLNVILDLKCCVRVKILAWLWLIVGLFLKALWSLSLLITYLIVSQWSTLCIPSQNKEHSLVCVAETAPVVMCWLYSVAFFYPEYKLYTVLFTSWFSKVYLGSLLLVLICLKWKYFQCGICTCHVKRIPPKVTFAPMVIGVFWVWFVLKSCSQTQHSWKNPHFWSGFVLPRGWLGVKEWKYGPWLYQPENNLVL